MARTLADEYRGLFDDLRASARGGPWEVLRRLRELMGERGVDAGRLRTRLNAQLVQETERVIRDIIGNGGERLAREIGSLSIPALEAFGSRLAGIRELYLDDAVARIDGEQDELKRTFLERLEAWATKGGELDVADIVEKMKKASDGRAKFFARDQFSRFNRSVAVASYRQAGAGYVEWLTSNDVRVRPEHKARNHRIYTQAELERDPEWKSYNCRCGFVPLWDLTPAQEKRRVA
jgi:SPP1 gp7 family putative phage head morphogenesis protein